MSGRRHAHELNMQTVPSLNICYTEEKVRLQLHAAMLRPSISW